MITKKHLFNKVADLKTWSTIKKRLQHRCLPVINAKVLRTAFLLNTSGACFEIFNVDGGISKNKQKWQAIGQNWTFRRCPLLSGHLWKSLRQENLTVNRFTLVETVFLEVNVGVSNFYQFCTPPPGFYGLTLTLAIEHARTICL